MSVLVLWLEASSCETSYSLIEDLGNFDHQRYYSQSNYEKSFDLLIEDLETRASLILRELRQNYNLWNVFDPKSETDATALSDMIHTILGETF